MFDYKLTIKFPDSSFTSLFKPLIWYDGPKMLLSFPGEQNGWLLSFYDYTSESELWFLTYNPVKICDYLINKATLREVLLTGKTYLTITKDFSLFVVKKELSQKELLENFVLPTENSFLGNLCSKEVKKEFLKVIMKRK